jgi:NADH:ubiquinone oxidoreductase subunit 5 (subunit L)/multisubunit Na+/H+ antiporter MnhA subunit
MDYILASLVVLGAITALYGAFVSAAQTDCKKLLAYSTISHCGFLFVTIGLNNIYLSITYLYLHGFFKALTFFCVGNLVKVSRGYQDTRKMGQLFSVLPIDSILLIICAANLGALPFTVGYFYKSLLLTIIPNSVVLIIGLSFVFIAMLCSVIYVFRLVFYSLFDTQKGNNTNFDYHFNKKNDDPEYSNTTVLGTIFVFLLLALSVYIYLFYISFLENYAFFNIDIDVDYLTVLQNIKKNNIEYFYLFYIFFCVICVFLIKITCRYEFSLLKKNNLIYVFILCLLFFQINFSIFTIFLYILN